MDLNPEEKEISDRAIDFIYANEDLLIEKFANDKDYPTQDNPISFFTAGSFGAGKTEFSQRLARKFPGIVLIDADEIRKLCPEYNGDKAYIFNGASFIGQDKLLTYALNKDKHFVFDSTFSNYKKARKNIHRSLERNRPVDIYYVFQHPRVAWLFTQVRARLRGRHITKEAFIRSVLVPIKVVRKIKDEFFHQVSLNIVEKSTKSDLKDIDIDNFNDDDLQELENEIIKKNIFHDVDDVDNHVQFDYSEDNLRKIL